MSALRSIPSEMPRERLLAHGPESLKTEELLAILFGTGRQGCDVLSMSRELLERYGGLKNLSRAHVAELTGKGGVKGIGEAKAVTLLAALELGRRAVEAEQHEGDVKDRLAFWARRLALDEREFIVAVYLDRADHPIADDLLSYGGPDGAVLDAPHLLRRAVRLDCASLALMHNHPDGSPGPSDDDISLTRRLAAMLRVLGIGFYGHFIAAEGRCRKIPGEGTCAPDDSLIAARKE